MSILSTVPPCVLYFGCIKEPGHYVHLPVVSLTSPQKDLVHKIGGWMQRFDQALHDESSSRWLLHSFETVDGNSVTFIAKRDNIIDKRPGSWAGFLLAGSGLPLYCYLEQAQRAFPDLHLWNKNDCKTIGS